LVGSELSAAHTNINSNSPKYGRINDRSQPWRIDNRVDASARNIVYS